MNKRVAIYIRVSSNEQKKEGLSLASQLKKLYEYAKFKGWAIVKEYKDEGISGGFIKKRKGFKSLLEDSKKGVFSALLVTKIDRAFRNTKEALITLDELNERDIDFVSVSEDIDTTSPMGKLFFTMISAFSQFEREVTKERGRNIWMDKFEKGMFPIRPPFGYKAKKRSGKVILFEINPKEAQIVKKCFLNANGGIDYKVTCIDLKLHPQQYYNIIRNPAYAGFVQFEGKINKGLHKPIISEEIFKKLNPNFKWE